MASLSVATSPRPKAIGEPSVGTPSPPRALVFGTAHVLSAADSTRLDGQPSQSFHHILPSEPRAAKLSGVGQYTNSRLKADSTRASKQAVAPLATGLLSFTRMPVKHLCEILS